MKQKTFGFWYPQLLIAVGLDSITKRSSIKYANCNQINYFCAEHMINPDMYISLIDKCSASGQ